MESSHPDRRALRAVGQGSRDVVHGVDRALTQHPQFGDSPRILAKVFARYRFGLELCADRLPGVAARLPAVARLDDAELRPLFFDPLLRLALERAFAELEADTLAAPHPLERWLPDALDALPSGLCEARMYAHWPVQARERIWIWDLDDADGDARTRELRALFATLYADGTLLRPDERLYRQVADAVALLRTLLPQSGDAALRHVGAVALVDARHEGGSVLSSTGGDLLPSTIFLAPAALDDPWEFAECLYHESLHAKLFDAVRSVTLIAAPDESIQVPWRKVRWQIVRALFSYHVYVHVSLFRAAALSADRECVARFGDPSRYVSRPHPASVDGAAAHYGRAIDRARYLGGQLRTTWSHLLTAQGRDLVRWLDLSLKPVCEQVFDEAMGEVA
jgi:hypothetical protein